MSVSRIAKTFEVEYGHRLCKHPEKCRFPHGHSLRIEVVARGRHLDDNDMVCDYKALKMLVVDLIDSLDHAMALTPERLPITESDSVGSRPSVVKWLFASEPLPAPTDGTTAPKSQEA